MIDLTQFIFSNSLALSIGLIIYYSLSFAKVFLLIRIQPMILQNDPKLNLHRGDFYNLGVDAFFEDSKSHYSTFQYLLSRGGKNAWKLIGNKKVDFYYNILDAITSAIKPFFIIAVIWAILKFLIVNDILYNELKITLGEIQIKVAYLSKYKFYKNFDKYKNLLFLFILILTSIIVASKKWENKIKQSKSIISSCLIAISTISSLTFFGKDLNNTVKNIISELQDLNLEIRGIHENIYKEVAKVIIYNDLISAVYEDINNNELEKIRLDSLHTSVPKLIVNKEVKSELTEYFRIQSKDFAEKTMLDGPKPINPNNNGFVFSDYMTKHNNTKVAEENSAGAKYWKNQNVWNKQDGKNYLEEAKHLKKNNVFFDPDIEKKIIILVDYIVEFIGEDFVESTAKYFNIDKLEIPKSIATFLIIEKYKESFAVQLNLTLLKLGLAQEFVNTNAKPFFRKVGDSLKRFVGIKSKHNKEIDVALNSALAKERLINAHIKVDDLIDKEILNILGLKYLQANNYKLFIEKLTEGYKSSIDIDNLSIKAYDDLHGSQSVDREKFDHVMFDIVESHPGSREGCPLCAYINSRKKRNIR